MDISCAILTGGKSTRMGRDKATLKVGEKTLVGHTHAIAREIFTDIMVISSLHASIEDVSARIVHDVLPMPGSLTGIASALLNADTPYVFVLGCDMPFLTATAIRHTIGQVHGEQVILPRTDGGFEPLHAVYHRSCLSFMLTCIERGHMKIERLFPFFRVKALPPDPAFLNRGVSVFTNVNTREDLTRAEKSLG
jgi:molybdopterin-guanine dinucleotide biosynthesis protein A